MKTDDIRRMAHDIIDRCAVENDQIEFSDEKISHIDFIIHSDELSLNDMTDKIYNLYINKLNELK